MRRIRGGLERAGRRAFFSRLLAWSGTAVSGAELADRAARAGDGGARSRGPAGGGVTSAYATPDPLAARLTRSGWVGFRTRMGASPQRRAAPRPREVLALAEALNRISPGDGGAVCGGPAVTSAGRRPDSYLTLRGCSSAGVWAGRAPPGEEQRAFGPVRLHPSELDVDGDTSPRAVIAGRVVPFRVPHDHFLDVTGAPVGRTHDVVRDGRGVPPCPAGPRRPPGLFTCYNVSPFHIDACRCAAAPAWP